MGVATPDYKSHDSIMGGYAGSRGWKLDCMLPTGLNVYTSVPGAM